MLYDNRFEMTRDSNTITATTISASAQYKTDGLPPGVNQAGADNGTILKMNEAVSDGDANPIQIAAYAEAVTYVKMIGSATRIGYPINAPNLLSIGGYTAVSIGQDIIIPESKPIGLVKFQNGAGCSIHRLSWERNYAINGNIRDFSNVRTTGRAEFYG